MIPRSQGLRLVLVGLAALATIPAVLVGIDRSVALSRPASVPLGMAPRSLDGARARIRVLLDARRSAEAGAEARAILRDSPLDQVALRVLARAEQALGHSDEVEMAATIATLLSWHDPVIQEWAYGRAFAAGDFAAAARRADALSRSDAFQAAGFAALAALLADERGAAAVARRLAVRPPWRNNFFGRVAPASPADAVALLDLLTSLSRTAAPPSDGETARVLWSLVARGYGAQAWAFWHGTHPVAGGGAIDDPDLALVRTPSGTTPPSPFTWTVAADAIIRIAAKRDAAGHPALAVEHGGDRSAMFVARYVSVAPGRYTLSYRASGDREDLDRLHPDVACRGAGEAAIGEGTDGGSEAESVYALPVEVSPGCALLKIGFTFEPGGSATATPSAIRAVTLVSAR